MCFGGVALKAGYFGWNPFDLKLKLQGSQNVSTLLLRKPCDEIPGVVALSHRGQVFVTERQEVKEISEIEQSIDVILKGTVGHTCKRHGDARMSHTSFACVCVDACVA